MKDTTEILQKLRKHLELKPLAAYIVPTDDEHQSEYICLHDERRAFLTGFDGSAGTAVVTADHALLWTDGRYYQQAAKQLDSNWSLMKDGLPNTPSIGNWLARNLPKGSVVGVDPKLYSYRVWKPVQKELNAAECVLQPVEENLVDLVWGADQPPRTSNKIIALELKYCGATVRQKWEYVKSQMVDKKVQAVVVSALDEIAWFLNMRGTDIDYNPVFFSYLIITIDELHLFIDTAKLPKAFEEHQSENEVDISIHNYLDVGNFLKNWVGENNEKVWIAPTSSYYLTSIMPKSKLHQEITPIGSSKAIKNETEIQGFINCHKRDGVALCQYFAWLENAVKNDEYVDEITGATKLEQFRAMKSNFMGLSFPTINGVGPNGSIIHYHPGKETKRQITDKEIYLCDSGAQYLDGTTDVTRTWHFGKPNDFEKECYTRVLKGQLTFGSTVFPAKVKGQVLDTIARKALWDIGLDYAHGTGHGVGHFLNVHEGPIGVGIRLMPDDNGLHANMFISNEPGYYQDGKFGIRIEDIVQIVPADTKYDFAGRGALTFRTVTMCPKQTKLIKKELLNEMELKLLNDYHKLVWETISPILEADDDQLTLDWLKKETEPI